MADNTIDIDIIINASKSAKTLKEQKDALKGLRDGLDQVKEGSGAFELLNDAANELVGSMDNLKLSFEDVYGEGIKPLTSQVGELEDRLYQMALAGQQNTQEFKDITAEAARLKLAVRDVDDSVDALATRGRGLQQFVGALSGIASGFAVAQGAAALLGADTEEFEKTMTKLTGVMAVANGLQEISNQLTERGTLLNKALNFVMKQNPIVLGLAALIAAATAAWAIYNKMTDKTSENEAKATKELEKRKEAIKTANEAIKENSKLIAGEAKDFTSQIKRLQETNHGTKERVKLIKELNSTYGTHLKNISDEKTFQDQLNRSLEDYLTYSRLKVAIQVKESVAIKEVEKQETIRAKALKLNVGLSRQQIDDVLSGNKKISDVPITNFSKAAIIARNEFDGLVGQFKTSRKSVDNIYEDIFRLEDGMKKFSFSTSTTTSTTVKTFKTLQDLFGTYADDLLAAQKALNDELAKENEFYYQSSIGYSEDYLTDWYNQWKTWKEVQYQAVIDANAKEETKVLADLKSKYDKVINQEGISEKDRKQALIDYNKEKQLVIDTYDVKEEQTNKEKNATILKQEKLTAKEILDLRKAAGDLQIQELEEAIRRSESAYIEGLGILSQKFQFSFDFPESTFSATIAQDVEESTKILKEFEEKNGEFGKIFQKQREGIAKAVAENPVITIEDRKKLNTALDEVNRVYEEDYKNLLTRISVETGITFTDIGKILSKNGEQVFTESEETIKSYYNLLAIQRQLYSKGLVDDLDELSVIPDLLVNEQDKLIFAQKAVISGNETLNTIFATQVVANEAIVSALEKREAALQRINAEVTDEYEKNLQIQNAYQESADAIEANIRFSNEQFEKATKGIFAIRKTADAELAKLSIETAAKTVVAQDKASKRIKEIDEESKTASSEEAKKLAQEKANIEKDLSKELETITLDSANKQTKILEDQNEKRKALAWASVEAAVQIANVAIDAQMTLENRRSEARLANIETERTAALNALDKERELKTALASEDSQAALAQLAEQRTLAEERQAIENEYNAKARQEKKDLWVKQRRADLIQSVINGALAVGKALGSAPPPLNFVLAGAAGIAAGIQTGLIASQPTPVFRRGGILDGPSHENGGILTQFGELEGGEAVINKKSTKLFAPMLSAINEAGGGKAFAPNLNSQNKTTSNNDIDIKSLIKDVAKEVSKTPIKTYVNESEITTSQNNVKRLRERNSF